MVSGTMCRRFESFRGRQRESPWSIDIRTGPFESTYRVVPTGAADCTEVLVLVNVPASCCNVRQALNKPQAVAG